MQECGECTLCCFLLETHDIPSNRGIYCKKCKPGIGCIIYKDRPKECREYQCMWSQMENVGIEMRPDKSHVIFDKISNRTICASQDPKYELNEFIKGQINFFLKEGFSIVIIKGFKKTVYVANGHTFEEAKKEVIENIKNKERNINGRTSLLK